MNPCWLDRRIGIDGPFLTLCLSQKEFDAALQHIGFKGGMDYLKSERSDATTHHFTKDGVPVCIVCLGDTQGYTPVEVAGLLVHEAVHVWQEHCESIGEEKPGREQEAYAVQKVAQVLMSAYSQRLG